MLKISLLDMSLKITNLGLQMHLTMAVDALAPDVAMPSAAAIWTMQDKWNLVFHKVIFQIPAWSQWWKDIENANTVWCHYNAVNFLQNPHKRHPIACPLGWGMRCLLCVQTLICILPQSLQWCMQYHVKLGHVIVHLTYNSMFPNVPVIFQFPLKKGKLWCLDLKSLFENLMAFTASDITHQWLDLHVIFIVYICIVS